MIQVDQLADPAVSGGVTGVIITLGLALFRYLERRAESLGKRETAVTHRLDKVVEALNDSAAVLTKREAQIAKVLANRETQITQRLDVLAKKLDQVMDHIDRKW